MVWRMCIRCVRAIHESDDRGYNISRSNTNFTDFFSLLSNRERALLDTHFLYITEHKFLSFEIKYSCITINGRILVSARHFSKSKQKWKNKRKRRTREHSDNLNENIIISENNT